MGGCVWLAKRSCVLFHSIVAGGVRSQCQVGRHPNHCPRDVCVLEAVRPPATCTSAVDIEFASVKECRVEVCVTRPCMGLPVVTASGRCLAGDCPAVTLCALLIEAKGLVRTLNPLGALLEP